MKTFVAAAGAACLCVLVVQAGVAHAGRLDVAGTPVSGGVRPLGTDKAGIDKTTTGSIGTAKDRSKGAKRETVVDREGTVIRGRIKGSERTTAYPKADKPAGSYSAMIHGYAAAYGVPPALAHAVVRVESNFNPKARGRAGEVGLMQIKPATARMMGYSGSTKGLYDPETNIKYGMKYLAMAHDLGGGTTCGTILKYNAGHAAKRMNPISRRYCGKVQAMID